VVAQPVASGRLRFLNTGGTCTLEVCVWQAGAAPALMLAVIQLDGHVLMVDDAS